MAEPDRGDVLISAIDRSISSVRTQSLDLSFNELADMYEDGELIIDPDFQRMFRWSEGAQSRFIESLLLELPLPPIFLIERDDRVYELIDGLQRISSYLNFRGQLLVEGKRQPPLILSDCDIVRELNGLTFDKLPRALDIKIKRSYIRAEILRKESDARLRYHMFKRLNTGGATLSEQEVRNATIRLLSNTFNEFIVDLSKQAAFQYCIDIISESARKRRFDQELVLRFFAFKNALADYKHDIGDFLTDYLERVSDPKRTCSFNFEAERQVFEKTFLVFQAIDSALNLGGRVFGSVLQGQQGPRGQFSVYHFEGLVLGLQSVLERVDAANPEHISKLADIVRSGKADPVFIAATGAGKNDPNPLRDRVQYFARRFGEAIG